MPTTLTLKIPDGLYARLKGAAAANRRSLSSEAISCLESVLLHVKIGATERLARVGQLRSELHLKSSHAPNVDKLKRLGRE